MLAGYVPAYGPPNKADIARRRNQIPSIDLVTGCDAASTLASVGVLVMPRTFCGGRTRGPGGTCGTIGGAPGRGSVLLEGSETGAIRRRASLGPQAGLLLR